jgi:hypothetical protein
MAHLGEEACTSSYRQPWVAFRGQQKFTVLLVAPEEAVFPGPVGSLCLGVKSIQAARSLEEEKTARPFLCPKVLYAPVEV